MTATDRNEKIILVVVAVLLIASVSAFAVFRIQNASPSDQEFTPPPFEADAKKGIPLETGEYYDSLDLSIDGGVCIVAMDANPAYEADRLCIYATSPAENTVWIRVVLYDQEQIIGESGILKPGEYIESVKLTKPVASGYRLKAKILTFEPDTYYSMGTAFAAIKVR